MPRFSIIVPVFNGHDVVSRCIESVLSQSFNDFELIVVDDGSTDDSFARITAFDDPRLMTIQQQNRGRCAARNRGAEMATGDYLVFLDCDDQALPNWLSTLESVSIRNPAVMCCGSIWKCTVSNVSRKITPSDHGSFYGNRVFLMRAGTYAIDRQRFHEIGAFDETLTLSEHTELSMRVVQQCDSSDWQLAHTLTPLVVIYDGGESMATHNNLLPETVDYILQKHSDLFDRDTAKQQVYLDIAARASVQNGDISSARMYLRKSQKLGFSAKRLAKITATYIPLAANLVFSTRTKPKQIIGRQSA